MIDKIFTVVCLYDIFVSFLAIKHIEKVCTKTYIVIYVSLCIIINIEGVRYYIKARLVVTSNSI